MIFRKLLSKSFVSAISLLATLILGILGNYVWLPFRTGKGEWIIGKFNFLSITIVGYGFYFPLMVMIITLSLFLLSIGKLLIPSMKIRFELFSILAAADIVCIILPILLGMQIFNAGIACMIALLLCNLILSLYRS